MTPITGTDSSGNPTATPSGPSAQTPVPDQGSWMSQLGNLFSGANLGNLFQSKNLAPLLSGGALAKSLLSKNSIPNKGMLQTQAGAAQNAALPLLNAQSTGQLPPGEEQQLQQQLSAQIAQIKSKWANMGMSNSSGEQQEIQAATNNLASQRSQMASDAVKTGLGLLGNANAATNQLAQLQLAKDKELQDAISNFTKAMSGGYGKQETQDASATQ